MEPSQRRFNTFRIGRVNARQELRKQLLIRNNLEKRFYKRLNTLFRKYLNTTLYLYKEFGVYEAEISQKRLNEEFMPLILSHYRRVFTVIYKNNEDNYIQERKAAEAFIFGRSVDFESLVEQYFNDRQLILVGITNRIATRISNLIEQGRADNLTLPQIAKLVSDKFLPITRSRAALIARTETHNAASFANHSYHLTLEENTGMKMLKKWVATNDIRTRPAHFNASGQTVDINENFTVGGAPMSYAGDSKGGAKNVINCRCVIVYVDERDME